MQIPLTILGGGPAGLAVAYFASKRGLRSQVYEAAPQVGGNCRTFRCGEFWFDSGAHRFHDKDPEITTEVERLLGNELTRIDVPSAIWLAGRFLPFPPSVPELWRHFGPSKFAALAASAALARISRPPGGDLASYATRAYGAELARLFLLNYSEKLWGIPCDRLSAAASGGRLRGLNLGTIINRRRSAHLDGAFRYPTHGYGMIVERLATASTLAEIQTGARITRIMHSGARITHVAVNDGPRTPVERVVSTLPLGLFACLCDPPLSAEVLDAARAIRFRHLILGAVFINRASVTPYASLYFPDPSIPFTRVSEPRNRSAAMAPEGKTSLVAEIPCGQDDALWSGRDEVIMARIVPIFSNLGWVADREIIGTQVVRLANAYPILDLSAQDAVDTLIGSAGRFENLHVLGRNGLFRYAWLHSLMRMGKDLVDQVADV
jgi:protoporphyrinogen oxidase